MGGHRDYYKVLRNDEDVDANNDDYSLGLHLVHEHGCVDRRFWWNIQCTDFGKLSTLWLRKKGTFIHS